MPIVGLNLEATRVYESKYDPDRGSPEATKFHIGTLDSRVSGKLKDMATTVKVDPKRLDDEVDTTINMEDVAFQTVQFGVVGWENLMDDAGNPIEFKTEGRRLSGKSYKIVHSEVLYLIPGAVIRELADEVGKANNLTEVQEKNSGAQSSQ